MRLCSDFDNEGGVAANPNIISDSENGWNAADEWLLRTSLGSTASGTTGRGNKALKTAREVVALISETNGMQEKIGAAEKVLMQARSQRLCCVIMVVLNSKVDNDSKQKSIKSECQEIRKHGLEEKDVLPKCVYDKMIRILTGR